MREEVVIQRELLLEFLQMDAQSVLSGNVVSAQEVVHSLEGIQAGQLLRRYSKILPCELPIQLNCLGWGETLSQLIQLRGYMQVFGDLDRYLLLVALEWLHGKHTSAEGLNLYLSAFNLWQLGLLLANSRLLLILLVLVLHVDIALLCVCHH